jgi:putative ABC transport system permease protein
MHIALRVGRELTRADDEHGAPVIIVSETLARRHWPGENPIGKRMTVEGVLGWPDVEREIVGVVSDVHHDGLNAAARSEMYVPYAQMPWSFATIVVRSAEDPRAVAAGVRTALAAVDKSQAASGFRSMETIVATSIAQWRFRSSLLGVFGAIALALTCVGLHGVVGQDVAQRMREIGVRMALGATSRDVAAAFVRSSMLLAAAGIAVGVPMALATTRMIRSSLFGIEPEDPITMAGAALLLLAVALLSAWLPARRAARVDPMVALRCE